MQFTKVLAVLATFSFVLSASLPPRDPEVQLPEPDESALSERQPVISPNWPPLCVPVAGQPWGNVQVSLLDDFLNNQLSDWYIAPNTCGDVWCNSNLAAVAICNGNNYELYVSAETIRAYVQILITQCQSCIFDNIMCWAGGQIFDSNNWNLLIKGGLGQGCSPSWKGRSTKVKRLPESEHSRDLEDSPEVEPSTDTKFPVPALPPRLADPANLSNPTRDSRSIKYRMEPVTFKGTYGGHAYELNGTITEVDAQLKELYPDVQLPPKKKRSLDELSALLKPRDGILPPLCVPVAGQPWGASNEIDLNEGINYLVDADNLAAVPTEACGAIWCNGWTSIILCNGEPPVQVGTWEMARAALDIRNICGGYFLDPKGPFVPQVFWAGGQEFNNEDYNVIVKESNNPVYPFGPVPNGGCGSGF